VVIDGNGKLALGGVLADYVLVQILLQFEGFGELVGKAVGGLIAVILEYRVADGDALVANVSPGIIAGRRDELSNNVLAFVAERTAQSIVGTRALQRLPPRRLVVRL
jgi:hypothetical protein